MFYAIQDKKQAEQEAKINGQRGNASSHLDMQITSVRAAKVRNQKIVLERAIQHLYPLELLCDRSNDATPLNPTAPLFRSRQDAAAAAELRILDIANDDQ